MNFYDAKVADILRCHQRDEAFVADLESQLHSFLKYFNPRTYNRVRRLIPSIANAWYYLMTSLGNLQTLGEEYSGSIRFVEHRKIPSKLRQTVWLILYIGGEPMFDRLLKSTEATIQNSATLTQQAKDALLTFIQCFRNQKVNLRRIHQSIFYIGGKYYNLANRFTGIRYVLLRQWMQDDSFSGSFELLGHLSLFYIVLNMVHMFLNQDITSNTNNTSSNSVSESTKGCVLCAENLKNASATPCGHIFCWECIYDSLSYQKCCPICREEVVPNRIIYLQNYM